MLPMSILRNVDNTSSACQFNLVSLHGFQLLCQIPGLPETNKPTGKRVALAPYPGKECQLLHILHVQQL